MKEPTNTRWVRSGNVLFEYDGKEWRTEVWCGSWDELVQLHPNVVLMYEAAPVDPEYTELVGANIEGDILAVAETLTNALDAGNQLRRIAAGMQKFRESGST